MRYQAGTDRGRDLRNPQSEDLLGFANAPKFELSEGFQASVAASRGLCEPRGKEETAVDTSQKLLHSNDFVDGWSDDGEVEPIRSADIAVQHFTDVECDVDLGEGQPFRLAPQVPRLRPFPSSPSRPRGRDCRRPSPRPPQTILWPAVLRVADEFEDMAITGPQRGRQRLKGLVQHIDDLSARGHV